MVRVAKQEETEQRQRKANVTEDAERETLTVKRAALSSDWLCGGCVCVLCVCVVCVCVCVCVWMMQKKKLKKG